ncbi:HAMP domain-containing histidine kinase [Salinicoccus cyprini]|uniref:Heme sensor protein HssS n=1 Tax=Salinicoccus cyprini TaxID=2493691 RepID=A0A558ASE6_9STAP|nr:HAMP domain-containing sensor histidine kinase [Salinicoccus cyprini]TVT27116.1 HAMP domain-containing histidine kinase [Salinicoccus cyprini]
MLNKLSLKIGLLFFIVVITVEIILFSILYTNLVNDRVDDVMGDLLARGNTHRDVLEENYTPSTLEHVAIMESESDFIVAITDQEGVVVTSSNPMAPEMISVIRHTDNDQVPDEGVVLESDWAEKNFVATDSPIIMDGVHSGHVFMFANSNHIEKIISNLTQQFLIIGVITVILTIITVIVLSKVITQPLVGMKQATEALSRGNHEVELSTSRKDELGELATAITRLSKDLKRLKNERNEFLSNVSHELRTPLTYLKGYTDIINRDTTSEEDRTRYTQIIQEETEHLAGLIKTLFELAKIDQNEFAIKKEKVEFDALIQKIVERIYPAIEERSIEFSYFCPSNVVITIDSERIQQVLLNILDNAIKYTPRGNHVRLEVVQNKNDVLTVISDTGEGISEEDMPYIFERLYRAEKSRSRSKGGSGLGLTIAKEIVELHNGKMEVESEPGEGTVFNISLPKEDAYEKSIVD